MSDNPRAASYDPSKERATLRSHERSPGDTRPLVELLDDRPKRVRVKRTDGVEVTCPRCRTWVAVITDDGPLPRRGDTSLTSSDPDIGDGVVVFMPAPCKCGALVALDRTTGEVLGVLT